MKNLRQYGNELEDFIVSKLKPIDKWAKRSSTSGAKGMQSDIICNDFYIECKRRNTKDFTIKEDIWNKLKLALPVHTHKKPLYITENKNSLRLVTLDIEDFFTILEKSNGKEKSS